MGDRVSAQAQRSGGRPQLTDRVTERGALDQLARAVRAGQGQALVIHGDPGVGKSVLLEYLAGRAAETGCRVAHAAGVQSEMELVFAGLHQLCAPLLDRADGLPVPQRDALRTAFAMAPGPPPDRFMVGLAVLSLLSGTAGERPLICLIDDEQWLDQASAQALGFVARRLGADPVGLVFAAREPGPELAGLPELEVHGLQQEDARALLDAALTAPLDEQVRDLIIAEAQGNPLALLELPRGLTPAVLAGGFGLPGALPGATLLTGRIEDSFRRQMDAWPDQTRQLVQLAAADPSGDQYLVWRAAGRLGIPVQAAAPAEEAGLVEFGLRVRFRHPLARSAAYQSASFARRRQLHGALADVTDPLSDPDRRAWHMAQAVPGADEDVAAELERSASRAQARGGLAAAAAFLERAQELTLDPTRRSRRALAAAQAKVQAGAPDAAQKLLAVAMAGPLCDLDQARAELVQARIVSVKSRGGGAPLLLLQAARRLEPIDITLARATYLDAMAAAMFAGRLASPGGSILEVARAAAAAPPLPHSPPPPDLLLDGLAVHYTQGYAAALPLLRQALAAADTSTPADEEPHWMWLACVAAYHVWDDERWELLSQRYIRLVRKIGALADLPLALDRRARPLLFAGELTAAAVLLDETRTIERVIDSTSWPYGELSLEAFRGREASSAGLINTIEREVTERGEGLGITAAGWANAVLCNGLGRYEAALAAAHRATAYRGDLGFSNWALVELVEAAAHTGRTETARGAYHRLDAITGPAGTDWALGLRARSRAMLSEDEEADSGYQEAISRLSRTRLRVDLARAHLVYGEWLRREQRRRDAREQLRTAWEMLDAMGMAAFAERARRELQATGETVRHGGEETVTTLTAQEALIAGLARDGLTNPEIGARLFLSARTVQYHLRKIFTKLGITSRRELPAALAGPGPDSRQA
jgi:DNA-binding CsgD family transcriptional regulator